VDIGPDLTKKQRQEEANMKAEAVRRNMRMEEEDRSKNLAWQVVGPRGEKRLVKVYVDMEKERQSRARVRAAPRGGSTRGGRGGRTPPVASGANNQPLGERRPQAAASEGAEEVVEEEVTDMDVTVPSRRGRRKGQTERGRLDSATKRKDRVEEGETEEEEGMLPPPPLQRQSTKNSIYKCTEPGGQSE
jgi:hypothetical protein